VEDQAGGSVIRGNDALPCHMWRAGKQVMQ